MKNQILFILSGDSSKASSRVRGFWIADELKSLGFHCSLNWHNSKLKLLRLGFEALRYDIIIFQKTYSRYHLFLLIWLKIFGKKVFLDIDDAPSRVNKKNTIINFSHMVRFSTKVFCGSHNLVKLVDDIKNDTAVLAPTSIKFEYYVPVEKNNSKICIGWIGNGKHYQHDLINLLYEPLKILSKRYQIRFKLVGACKVKSLYTIFGKIKNLELDFIDEVNWGDSKSVALSLSDIDIGVYPLLINDFNSYKCGFKALEYFAMKIPIISSPNDVNKEIIIDNENGYLVNNEQEWVEALEKLIIDDGKRTKFGVNGFNKIVDKYSTLSVSKLISNYI